jgi:hypothetical protein
MPALTLMIIRHAEKPGKCWPGPGLTVDGLIDSKSLVVRGWQRAGAWAASFGAATLPENYLRPTAIYAARPESCYEGADASQRPYETVLPLAQRLAITPVKDFAKGAERELAQHLKSLTGIILVCWEHKAIIAALIPALSPTIGKVPPSWGEERYDVILRMDRADVNQPWTLRQLLPQLLSGDTGVPL